MSQQILGLNTFFESLKFEGFTEESFSYHISLLDYDAVVINVQFLSSSYPAGDSFLGKDTLNNKRFLTKDASCQIVEDYTRIREQLIELLHQGKTIFILMGENDNCYVHDVDGRNTLEHDAFSFLPVSINTTFVSGDKIAYCCSSPYIDFFNRTKECCCYAAYFSISEKSTPLAKIAGSDKTIAAMVEYGCGKIVFLPYAYCEEEYVSKSSWKKYGKIYLESLFELSDKLQCKTEAYKLPKWTEKFSILDESKYIKQMAITEKKINKLKETLKKQQTLIQDIQKYKRLLTTTGEILEEIVNQVLSELGFTLYDVQPGRDDIIAKYNDFDIVAEIKGVKKSAAEKHAAQLEKWASTYFEKNEHAPKPLLIVNGYCETPVQERKEPVFPDQMIPYSTSRNHALLSTTQLLCLYIEIQTNPSVKEDRIKELLETVGVYQRYDDISQYIKCVNETGETND